MGKVLLKCSWCGKVTSDWYAVPPLACGGEVLILCGECYNNYAQQI